MRVPLIRLTAGVNNYEWGKQGKKSAAARYAAASGTEIDESKPYAELWMGTHPSLPSKDFETGRTLLDLVQDNVSLISTPIAKKFNNQLPFLFKVLSVNKALSIQAHPNKQLAEQLHKKDPKHYPDDNHKPEMTIAITPFDGLCGFRPLAEIAHFLKTVAPLGRIMGESVVQEFITTVSGHETTDDPEQAKRNKAALQKAFSSLMNNAMSDATALKDHCRDLVLLAETETGNFAQGGGPSPNGGQVLSDLVLRLNEQFPGDVGLLVLFFLNYVQLSPGEAMFLRADDIHAYLSGDIIECMAASDNVIRAGFTPKFKDVDTLTNTLTYNYAPISEQKMQPTPYPHVKLNEEAAVSNSNCTLYDPPIEEFSVIKTDLGGTGKATFEPLSGPSILLCTSGRGTIRVGPKFEPLEPGYVYFIGATGECILECVGEQRLVTFTAFCELEEQK